MAEPRRAWSDQHVEEIVGNLLRIGVTLAAAVVLAGGVLFLIQHGREVPDYTQWKAEKENLPAIGTEAASGHSAGIILLGIVLLIATPVARVAFSVFAFVMQRDRTYVVVTLIVLMVLLYSLTGGWW